MRVKKTRKSEETRRKLPVLYTFSSSYWENICYTHTSVLHLHSQRGDEMTSLVCVKLYKGVRARELLLVCAQRIHPQPRGESGHRMKGGHSLLSQ